MTTDTERIAKLERERDGWRYEAKASREAMAKIAEALGWTDVRQDNGDLRLPCGDDIVSTMTKHDGNMRAENNRLRAERDAAIIAHKKEHGKMFVLLRERGNECGRLRAALRRSDACSFCDGDGDLCALCDQTGLSTPEIRALLATKPTEESNDG